MNNVLLNSVNRQKPELKLILDSYFAEQTMTPHLRKSLDVDVIKVIVGPRRLGKSSLADQVLKGRRFAYFNFKDESLTFAFTSDQRGKLLKLIDYIARGLIFDISEDVLLYFA